ncbi:MAG: metal ABC transporter permease [Verrucomicrobiota bacterium]
MSAATNFFVMQISLIAVVLVLHTYIGLHIIRRGIIFSDLVLDQLAAFGVMLGIGWGLRYGTSWSYVLAMLATLIGCALLTVSRPRNKQIPQEAVIGILYGMALVASLLLADKMREGNSSFSATMVGSMLWVSWPLVWVTIGIYAALGLLHIACRRPVLRLTEDASVWPRRAAWDFLFFVTQGIITILIVPVAGVLLAYGFLMIPAAIGAMFSRRWVPALLIGWGTGFAACVLGVIGSYKMDSPYGPTLMLAMGVFFVLALVVSTLLAYRKASALGVLAGGVARAKTGGVQ